MSFSFAFSEGVGRLSSQSFLLLIAEGVCLYYELHGRGERNPL
jgi:hypothetical protein